MTTLHKALEVLRQVADDPTLLPAVKDDALEFLQHFGWSYEAGEGDDLGEGLGMPERTMKLLEVPELKAEYERDLAGATPAIVACGMPLLARHVWIMVWGWDRGVVYSTRSWTG